MVARWAFILVVSLPVCSAEVPGADRIPLLIQDLTDASPRVRLRATWALQRLEAAAVPAVPALVELLQNEKDDAILHYAGRALLAIGRPAVPELAAHLEDKEVAFRREAARVLSDFGTDAAVALPELERAIRIPDEELGLWVSKSFVGIGPLAVPALVRLVQDPERKHRHVGLYALAKLGPVAAPAVPALSSVLVEEKEIPSRILAVEALGAIGPEAASTAPALVALLAEKNLSYAPSRALRRMGAGGLTALLKAIDTSREDLRLLVLETLGNMDDPDGSALVALVARLQTANEREKAFLVRWMKRMEAHDLNRALQSAQPAVRQAAQVAARIRNNGSMHLERRQ